MSLDEEWELWLITSELCYTWSMIQLLNQT